MIDILDAPNLEDSCGFPNEDEDLDYSKDFLCSGDSIDYSCPSEDPFPLVKHQLSCKEDHTVEQVELMDECPKIPACRKPEIEHGSLFCPEAPKASLIRTGIECHLICQSGFLPMETVTASCKHDELLDEYLWDTVIESIHCIPQIGIAVGGILKSFAHTAATDIIDPLQLSCRSRTLPDYPLKVAGAFAGRVNSHVMGCGGAVMTHGECNSSVTGTTFFSLFMI